MTGEQPVIYEAPCGFDKFTVVISNAEADATTATYNPTASLFALRPVYGTAVLAVMKSDYTIVGFDDNEIPKEIVYSYEIKKN